MRKKKKLTQFETYELRVAALPKPQNGFLKDSNVQRILPKSEFLKKLESQQLLREVTDVEILLPSNVAKIRR